MARLTAIFDIRDRMTNRLQRTRTSLDRLERATKLVAMSTAAMGAAFAVAGGLATQMAMDIDRGISKLKASTNVTAATAKRLGFVAKEVFEQGFGESISEVINVVATLRRNLGEMSDSMTRDLTQGALVIEEISNGNLAFDETSKTIKVMTANFEKLSKIEAMDLIVTGFKRGGDFAQDLLDTLTEYSPQFASIGMRADQMLATLLVGADKGAFNLDKVGDAVKEFKVEAIGNSKEFQNAFVAMGLNVKDITNRISSGGEEGTRAFVATLAAISAIEDPLKRNQVGVALFKTKWEDLRDNIVLAMTEGQKGLEDYQGITKKVADELKDNLGSKITKIYRQFLGMFSDGSTPIMDKLNASADRILKAIPEIEKEMKPMLESLSNAILGIVDAASKVYNFFKDNWSWIGPFVEGLTISFLAYKGVLMAINAWTKIVTLSQWLWNAAMAANPIGLVVTGIGILIGVGILLYKNWDKIKKKAGELWDKIMDNPLLALAAGPIGVLIAAGISLYKNWDKIKSSAGELWRNMNNIFRTGVNNAIDYINKLIDTINLIPGINIGKVEKLKLIGKPAHVGDFRMLDNAGITPHAAGGILTRPHLGLVAEAGPEAIIPLSSSRRSGALKLWEQVGRMMGVMPHADGGIFGRIKGFFGNNKIQNFAGNAEMAAIGLESSRRGYDKTLNSVYANYEKKMAKVNSIADAYKIRDIGHKTKHLTQGFGNITKMLSRVAIPLALFEGATEIIAAEDKKRAFLKELGATIGGIGAGALAGAMGGALVGAGVFSPLTAMAGAILGAGAGAFGGQALADMLYDRISKFATGTNFAPGGLSLVGEQGPELVDLPRGSRVLSNKETQAILGSVSGRSQVVHKKVNIEQLIGSVTVQNEADEDRLVAKIKRLLERELEEELLAGGGAHAL